MTHLANSEQLLNTPVQLPVSWYCDPHVYETEMRLLFGRNGHGYVGHELMVPNVGDYYTLNWMDNAKALVRSSQGVQLLSNVCRHRQSIILKGKGSAQNIVCPLHRWTYDMDGKLLGAPHFPGNPCLDLANTPLTTWNGMLFAGKRDIARDFANLGVMEDLDFSGYVFDRMTITDYNINWKTFMEVYLELYHVIPFHPGLGQFVDPNALTWEHGDWYNAQIVGINNQLLRPGTETYRPWHEQVIRYMDGKEPRQGAIWLTYYPNLMIEWYPNALVISTIIPHGPEKCTNVCEFYYPEDIALFEREYVEAQQRAYDETAIEDEEICDRMTQGRRALYDQGIEEFGPYQSPMEDGLVHFHEFMRREVEPHL